MSEESFVMVSLKDEKSKKLAEVISNKTARKILEALTKKEFTESELAEQLELPISTVHYNLKHLMKAKLVTVDEFHYSEKGKEVNHYKLANKFVIITPEETPPDFMDKLKKILPVTLVVAAGAVLLKAFNFFTVGSITAEKSSDMLVETARAPPVEMLEMAADVAEEEAVQEVHHISQGVTMPFYSNPDFIFWFLIGVVCTLIVYILIEYIKHKKR